MHYRFLTNNTFRVSALLLLALGIGGPLACGDRDTALPTEGQADTTNTPMVQSDEALLGYLRDIGPGGALDSWAKRNAHLPQHGCIAADGATTCLASKADFTIGGASVAGPATSVKPYRIVNLLAGGGPVNNVPDAEKQLPSLTSYWLRSSADGRYVGMSDWVLDLDRWDKRGKGAMIKVDAPYDPQFSADNRSMAWAGIGEGDDKKITICAQSALDLTPNNSSAGFDFSDDSCTAINGGVYQTFGTALDTGAPMFMADSPFHTNDDGIGDIEAIYSQQAFTRFTPLRFNGTSYDLSPAINVSLPFEGDLMLSPSGRLFVTRVSDGQKQTGYRISQLDVKNGETPGTFQLSAKKVGFVAMRGAKANFSFDERWLVTHTYKKQADLHLTGEDGASDIVLIDLLTAKSYQLTHMPAGVKALYPHFRSDGWIHFVVRDFRSSNKKEYLLATDAAQVFAAQ